MFALRKIFLFGIKTEEELMYNTSIACFWHTGTQYLQIITVLRPGKGECADPMDEAAILEKERGGGAPQPE